jgi:rhodanese-related sulfurtransferase
MTEPVMNGNDIDTESVMNGNEIDTESVVNKNDADTESVMNENDRTIVDMERPEITLDELADLTEGSFLLIDVRDEASYEYGTMENAIHFPDLFEEARAGRLPADKKLVLFCMHGLESLMQAEELRRMGFDAVSLKDGYGAFLRAFSLKREDRSGDRALDH